MCTSQSGIDCSQANKKSQCLWLVHLRCVMHHVIRATLQKKLAQLFCVAVYSVSAAIVAWASTISAPGSARQVTTMACTQASKKMTALASAAQSTSMTAIAARLRQLADAAEASDGGAVVPPHIELAAQLSSLADTLRQAGQPPSSSQSHTTVLATGGPAAAQVEQAHAAEAAMEEQGDALGPPASKKQKRAPREFDFSRYKTRYVALELMYVGTTYQGFARQETTDNTIEAALLAALKRTKLIPDQPDMASLKYSRCGRTDKGVSALGQVIAIMLRSSATRAPHHTTTPAASSTAGAAHEAGSQQPDSSDAHTLPPQQQEQQQQGGREEVSAGGAGDDDALPPPHQELDYPRLINRALPKDIRILGWTPVPHTFNARFSCRYRQYKYFISNRDGDLDIEAMRDAAQLFVGQHDFRNFCKPDVLAVRSFDRHILSFTLEPFGVDAVLPHPPAASPALLSAATAAVAAAQGSGAAQQAQGAPAAVQVEEQPPLQVVCRRHRELSSTYAFTVTGTAFLWHQVRCMVAVLMMVGRGQEPPTIISRLLDIKTTPCKPVYQMAAEEPLLLYACGFEGLDFIRSPRLASELSAHVRDMCESHLVAAALTGAISTRLARDAVLDACEAGYHDSRHAKKPQHVPLLKRPVEASVEERMAKVGISSLGQPRNGVAVDDG